MARAKKRNEVPTEGGFGLLDWLPGAGAIARLLPPLPSLPLPSLPSIAVPDWPFVTRSDLAQLSDRLIRLERRLAEHERAQHAPARASRQSLSA